MGCLCALNWAYKQRRLVILFPAYLPDPISPVCWIAAGTSCSHPSHKRQSGEAWLVTEEVECFMGGWRVWSSSLHSLAHKKQEEAAEFQEQRQPQEDWKERTEEQRQLFLSWWQQQRQEAIFSQTQSWEIWLGNSDAYCCSIFLNGIGC